MHLVGKVSDHGNYSFHCVAFMICILLHLGLVFISFTVGITCMDPTFRELVASSKTLRLSSR